MTLPIDVAMTQYEALRTQFCRGAPGAEEHARGVDQALMAMWERYTLPYRVVRLDRYGQELHPHYVVYRVEGHGLEHEVWHLRGEHRERDAVRMSVMLRNEKLLSQQEALEQGELDWSLRQSRANVLALQGIQLTEDALTSGSSVPESAALTNEWRQTSPFTEEYQTLEYVLEFGGEGGRAAIVRTHLRGRPRYWTLVNHLTWDDDEPQVGGTSLEYLGTEAETALRACPYRWPRLVGLALAPDLIPVVQAILSEEGKTLDDWLQFIGGDDAQQWSCQYVWWNCDAFTPEPVDAYWLTARPEVVRRTLGGLSQLQVAGLTVNPGEPVGVLVDRSGRVLITEAYQYPTSNMWSVIPFSEVRRFQVNTLVDLPFVAPSHPLE
ncbi:hypothetical protein [Deinococcus arcticus]|uniref:Uncharacterized protein n=1 Tax=Deinococcus arcticus TaxID=2136176 RepID=A0A2T3W4U0_9DEIO|nr:hypothetical protein [Deinococcus arcticus]PTA66910.1 hypothetical protein C8263_15180 [Deinococcus arcticus]